MRKTTFKKKTGSTRKAHGFVPLEIYCNYVIMNGNNNWWHIRIFHRIIKANLRGTTVVYGCAVSCRYARWCARYINPTGLISFLEI